MSYKEVCTGCGEVKDIVSFELGIRRFCRSCANYMDKNHILTLKTLNHYKNYKPPKGVYQI